MLRVSWWTIAVLALTCGCAPAPFGLDASIDRGADAPAVIDTPAAADAPTTRCASDRECSARGLVCNATTARCVECNAAPDCGGDRVCLGNRCITPMRCTTSRMCPGQVCSTTLGYCVDCAADLDCSGGQVCRDGACVAPPRACRSSRECSDMGQVCDMARSQCVDCAADTDCPSNHYCGPGNICVLRADAGVPDAGVDGAGDAVVVVDGGPPRDAPPTRSTQRSCATPIAGCGLVELEGGTFTMGSDIDCSTTMSVNPACVGQASPSQPSTTVGPFALDAYEVTVARFNEFWRVRDRDLAEVRRTPIAYPGGRTISWDLPAQPPMPQDGLYNWSPTSTSRDAHPVNGVDWWAAQEFCVWDGGRLPTQAEWEFAARARAVSGLASGRIYPWGDEQPTGSSTTPCDRAQWHNCAGEDGGITRRVGRFASTGGFFDLAGNVTEWMADWYAPYSDTSCWNRMAPTNPLCTNPGVTGRRVMRGGARDYADPQFLRGGSRRDDAPVNRGGYIGIRCARTR